MHSIQRAPLKIAAKPPQQPSAPKAVKLKNPWVHRAHPSYEPFYTPLLHNLRRQPRPLSLKSAPHRAPPSFEPSDPGPQSGPIAIPAPSAQEALSPPERSDTQPAADRRLQSSGWKPVNPHTDGVSHGEPSESRRSEAPYTKVYFLPFPEGFFYFSGDIFLFHRYPVYLRGPGRREIPTGWDEAVPATDGEKKS